MQGAGNRLQPPLKEATVSIQSRILKEAGQIFAGLKADLRNASVIWFLLLSNLIHEILSSLYGVYAHMLPKDRE